MDSIYSFEFHGPRLLVNFEAFNSRRDRVRTIAYSGSETAYGSPSFFSLTCWNHITANSNTFTFDLELYLKYIRRTVTG